MVATLARRVARKSRRNSHRIVSREARRRLFMEALEDRRLLAGLEESLVSGESSVVAGQASVVTGRASVANDQGPVTNDYVSVRREWVIIDAATPDYRRLARDVIENAEGTRQFDVLLIDSASDGVEAVGQILSQYRDLDAVHLISHGSPGQVRLGSTVLSGQALAGYSDSLRGWAGALKADADILVYGCDVAAGAAGASLVDQLAALTGADVAASDDPTGQAARGGDWDLEVVAGQVETSIALGTTTQLAWAGLLAPQPAVTVNMPAAPFIGADVNFTVVFENDSPDPSDEGYGPFVDLIFPVNGADGDLGALPPEAQDGLTFSTASYLGIDLVSTEFLFPDDGSGFGCVDHPYAVDATGAALEVCGPAGDQLVVLELPFGSFVPDQPEVTISVTATMPDLADLGHDLTVLARGGFRYGTDPLDNPSAPDPTILTAGSDGTNSTDWADSDSSAPVVMTMTKRNNAPESETATGPNYPRTWTLTVSIADRQRITNLDIIDGLPNNVVVESIAFSFPNDPLATVSNIPATPFGPTDFDFAADELLLGTVNSVTGSGGADVVVTVDFYVPEFDAEGDRIIPLNGEDDIALVGGTVLNSQSPNDSYALGDWTPIDTRDLGTPDNAFAEPVEGDYDDILDDKSIAIQKGVRNVVGQAPPGNSPGDTLEYTLEFQISDYYTYGDLIITDTYQDGQNLAAFTPTFEVTDRHGNVSGSFALNSTYTHTDNDSTSGTETLVFYVSQAMLAAGAADGILEGGATHGELDTAVNAAARGTIRFRTVIQEEYAQSPPSTDKSVDQGDLINNNTLRIDGSVRENYENDVDGNRFNVIYANENDNSSAGVTIIRGDVTKTIYAVNGVTTLPNPVEVAPGDTITYMIGYDLAISDFEQLRLTDFLPLPVFDVENPDANGALGPAWSFSLANSFDAVPPPAGVVEFAPTDTFYHSNSPASNIVPAIGIDGVANSLYVTYGNYDSPQSTATAIRLLFTVTVTDDPFADGLFLTNIVRATEQNSFVQTQVADQIIQIRLGQPVLNLKKGVVASDGPDRMFTPASVAPKNVSAPGSDGFRFQGVINSDDLALTPIDSDLSHVDAGDLVTFAVIVENTGSSHRGAFDVQLSDVLPAGFAIPTSGRGLNLQVTDGTGAEIEYTELGNGGGDDLFGAGIELTDPGPTDPTAYGSDGGAVDRYDANNGRNLVVLTYDLVALDTVSPREVLTNTATIAAYAGTEGGENHVQPALPAGRLAELSDDAQVTISVPAADKSLVGTSVVSGPNENDEAVIGEAVQYEVVLTLVEGQMHLSNVVDTLDLGLRFVGLDSITRSSGDVTTTRGAGNFSDLATFSPSTTGDGSTQAQTLTFNFGTLRNANTDNATDETLTVRYTVQVLNTAQNQGEGPTELANSAVLNWDVDGIVGTTDDLQALLPVSADPVTVIEPELQIDKSVVVGAGGTVGDAGDTVTYTVVVEHTADSDANALDVTFLDPLPITAVNVDFATGVTVTHSTLGDIKAAFELVGGQLRTGAGQSLDLAVGQTVTITVVGTVRSSAIPLQTVNNTGTVEWTSLDGVVPEERTGTETPAVNDYTAEDSASFAIRNINVVKSVKATSETHTPDGQLAIGEIIRYRLQTTLPEGTSPSFTVTDFLPSGLQFRADGTATLAFVSSSGAAITTLSTEIDDIAAGVDGDSIPIADISPTYPIPLAAIDPDTFSDGTDPVFNLGTLTNLDSDPDLEYVVIEFNALVLNAATARDGDLKDNSYQVQVSTNTPVLSNPVTSRIVEPSITNVLKSVVTAPGDADDTVRYRVTYTNEGSATAFDVRLEDQLPAAELNLNEAGVTVSFSGSAPYPAYTNNSFNDKVDVRIGELPVGVTVTVEYTATLILSGINPGETIPNVANVSYTSLPGTGTVSNPTGSIAPGGSGTLTGERNGTVDPVDENDYLDSDDASFVVQRPAFVKSIVESSEAHTSGTDLAVGEIVRYRLQVRVPEVTMPDFRITDALPSGLQFLNDGTTRLALVSDELNFTSSGGIDARPAPDGAGVSGTQTNIGSIRPSYVLPSNAISPATGSVFTSGIDPVFRLGELVNRDSDDDEEFVVIEFNALVLNATNNDAFSTTLANYRKDNTATLAVGPTFTYSSNTVAATILEPAITKVAKRLVGAAPVDAFDTVTYEVEFSNSGNADAFDVRVYDELDAAYFTNVTVTSVTRNGVVLAAPADYTNSSAGNVLDLSIHSLNDFGSPRVIVRFTAQLTVNVQPLQTIPNTVDVTYTSLPGTGSAGNPTGSVTPGGSGDFNGERNGADGPGGLNDYRVQGTVDFRLGQPALDKSINTTSNPYTALPEVTIGEVVTYQVVLTVPEGTTENAVVVDTVRPGLSLLDIVSITADGPVTSSFGFTAVEAAAEVGLGTNQSSVTLNFGRLTNAAVNDGDAETITVLYRAVVLNTLGNTAGRTLDNSAAFTWTGGGTPLTATAPELRVVEPVMTVEKSADKLVGDAGDVVTFTIDIANVDGANGATALDVVLSDLIPAHTTYVPGSVAYTGGAGGVEPNTPISEPAGALTIHWDVFPKGGESQIQFQVTLDVTVGPGLTLSNTAELDWTSMPGDPPPAPFVERTGDPTDPGLSANDYHAEDSVEVGILDPSLNKLIVSTSELGTSGSNLAIGEIVRYQMYGSIVEGSLNDLVLRDVLPPGMALLNDGQIRIGFIANNPMTLEGHISGAQPLAAPPPTFLFPSDHILIDGSSLPAPNPADPVVLGRNVAFDIGTVVNNDDDADTEYGVLEFNVIVLNTDDNDAFSVDPADYTKHNQFELDYVIGGVSRTATSDIVTATIVEPRINVTKTLTTSPYDAGDVATYEVTFTNTGNAPAYDVRVVDVLPAWLDLTLDPLTTVEVSPTAGFTDNSLGNTVNVTIAAVPVNGSVTVRYSATLIDTIPTNTLVENEVDVTYTSLSGTGTSTPGVSGDTDGERNGSGVLPNDYLDSDGVEFITITPSVDKSVSATSFAGTGAGQLNPAIEDVTIGETVTYRMVITLPEGTTQVRLTDTLPSVLTVVSSAVVSIGGTSTAGATAGTQLSVSTLSVGAAGTASDFNPIDTWNDRVIFDFGTVTNLPDGVSNGLDQIVVQVVALVRDVIDNADADRLRNVAMLDYGEGTHEDTVDVEIVEPLLAIDKSAAPVDGSRVRYTVRVADPSPTAAAYGVVITDLLNDPNIALVRGSVAIAPGTTVPGGGNVVIATGNGGSDTTVRIDVSTFPLGGVLVFTYDAILADPANQFSSIDNTADFEWWSLPGNNGRHGTDSDVERLGAIGDRVWYDDDRDGVQDVTEHGIAGVSVELIWAGPGGVFGGGDDVTLTTVTDVNGNYLFSGLPAGVYRVTATEPVDTSPTYDAVAPFDGVSELTLAAGQVNRRQDFGYVRLTSMIGDRVWLDEDADGVQDAGEDGIANVIVELLGDTNGDGTPDTVIAETVTGVDGGYLFHDLPPGNYTVLVDATTLPAGLRNRTYDEDDGTTSPDGQTDVTLEPGQEYVTADFGYNWAPSSDVNGGTNTGAIGDRVWIDTDGHGDQDSDEIGLENVTVTLWYDSDGDGDIDAPYPGGTAATDATGNYLFDALPGGIYEVVVTPPAGYDQTGDPDGALDDQTTAPIVLAPGDVYVNADFGYQPTAPTGSIGDTVWFDADADGTFEPAIGEYGIAGVSVSLIQDSDGDGVWDAGEPVIATVVTDEDGRYLFAGLPVTDGAGTDDYLVWVSDAVNVLDGLQQTFDDDGVVTASLSAVTNLTTTAVTDQDFGYAAPDANRLDGENGVIGDTIFIDFDAQGDCDVGEGREGVTVNLYDSMGTTLLGTTVTDENGRYYFADLDITEDYVVVVPASNFVAGGALAGTNNTVDPNGDNNNLSLVTTFTIGANLDQDFGYRPAVANRIGGTIWADTDADGTLEGGESVWFDGVTVVLRDPAGNVVAATTTAADGTYLFSGLPNGTYTVDVTDEANVLNGYWHSDGPNDNADNNSQNDPYTVSVAGGQTNTTGDFGYYVEPAAVGNFVWDDLDGDGVQDDGEPGILGVTVTLTITYPNGTVVRLVDVTEVDGSYSFENLLQDEDYDGRGAGEPSFVVSVAAPAGYLTSPVNAGTPNNDAADSDNHAGQPVTLVRGQMDETIDFGLCRPVTIGNFVWNDLNGNGQQDSGEPGVNGVTVTASGTTGAGAAFSETTATAGNGGYLFTDLPPGTYQVAFTNLPAGMVFTAAHVGNDATDSDAVGGTTAAVTLASGGENLTLDAGLYTPARLGNFVWNDLNGNGQQDSGEPSVNGVTVTVSGTTGAGVAFSETTATAGNGGYLFTDLPPGTYQVAFTNLPAGMVFTAANVGNDATDSDAVGGTTAAVTLASGGENLTLDAGLYTPARLGNFVWNDLNGNGQQDSGEPGVNGVTVTVSGTTGAGAAFSETTATAGNGGYLFTDLPPGAYQVAFTNLPAGMMFTAANVGNDATDSDAVGGTTAAVTLASGGENLTLDAGLYTPARLGNFVWNDLNGNGVQDDGVNRGIPGVTLTLTGTTGTGASVNLTAITGADGQYEFADLAPGTYRVSATAPTGFVATATGRGTTETDSNASPSGTTPTALPGGGSDETIDFGFYEPVTIGDLVWEDANANGQQDFDEAGLAGVVVNLYRPGYGADGIPGNADDAGVVATRTTPASGVYSFTNLPPGTYLVDFVPPAGYIFSPQNRGNDDTDSDADFSTGQTPLVTAAAGEEISTLDAGLVPVLGAIGNRVWLDEDGDGLQDAGEPGIGGLTVRLTPPAGGNLGAGAGQPITTVTGTDGGYLFPDLPAGQYTVTVVPTAELNQTGDPDATLNNTTTVTLAAGQEIVTADFGYNWVPRTDSTNPASTATGAIGDRIWNDANGDGVQDPGETGLPGITVRLLRDTNGDGIYGGAGDTGMLTTTTDVRGQYIFDTLAPGAYVIDVNTGGLPAGWSATPTGDPDGDGDTTTEPIIIAPGDVYVLGDFGFQPSPAATSYTIGDQVFVDIDGDGVLDIGEPVIPGVTVNLLNAGGQVLATTVTDENGQYEFPDLVATPGTVFTVEVTDTDHVLGELAPISDQDGTLDNRTTVTIVAGTTDYPTADFGYAPPGHAAGDGLIGSTVFLDRDGNGAYTPGEGIEGITVWLYDATATTLLGITATDENGNYYFGGLDPDETYRVIVDGAGIPGGAQSMVNPPGSPGPSQGQVNLAVDPDSVNLDQDFGYGYIAPDSSAGDITGVIWGDPSADGTRDPAEPGRYANVEVVLRDADGNVVAITTTIGDGSYRFLNVPPGSYTVDVIESGPVLNGLWHSTGVNSQADPAPVTVVAGGVYTLDFGYYAEPAAIGNRVWVDTNGNGIQDTDALGDFTEPGIPDVPVTLRITYPNGAVTTVVTRTDAAGNYLFPNLLLDETFDGLGANEPTYTVSMATPTGMTPTGIAAAGSTTANDSNNPAGSAATVTEGQTNETIDFGFRYIGSLSGVVYSNTDSDLARDAGEAGISGVTVYLDSNNNGALDPGEPTTTTNSSGQYTFSYLPPGTYYVRQLVPDGTSQTAPLGNAALVEDLALGEAATGLDFGDTPPPGTILDDGDPGVTYPGWFVSYCPLFFNADGRYLCNAAGTMTWNFSGLAAGVYRVSTTWLAGSAFTTAATYQVTAASGTTTAGPYNQQLPPSSYPGYSASGYYWADLTTAIEVPAGGTLTVSLAAPATGCVNGDAVRIMPASTPEITVLNGTATLTDGSSTVNMGSTGGSPITYAFTVRNDGGGTLNLGTLSVPSGYTSTGPVSTSLAFGTSTTFTVTLPAGLAAGTYSGQVVLGNNDNSEAPFNFTIQGTVGSGSPNPQPSAPPPAPIVPLAAVPILALSEGGAVLANVFGAVDFGTVTAGAAASRTFTVTNTGTADVELCPPTLPAGFSLATAYGDVSLTPGESTTFAVSLITATVGTFSGDMVLCNTDGEGLFSVQLTGTVTEATIPTATKAIIDDGDAGFTAGGFTTYSASSGYLGDVRYATQNTVETKVAQWQFSLPALGLADGLYRVSTLWYIESSRASQATFKLYNGAAAGTPQTTAVVNQQVAPRADVVDEGRNWQDLGVVLVSGGVLTVTTSDLAVGGAVVADAVRIERVVSPEIQVVLDSTGADLVDGSTVVDFGSVFAGSTSQLTLRVKNVGAGTVALSAPTLTGTGFTLVSGPASTSLSANDGAAGGADETTITIAMATSVAGSKSGTLALVNSDANENPFDLPLQGTVSSVKVIDDGDAGFVQSGPSAWLTWADGYLRDLRYSAKNTGRTATWTFTDLPNGTYRVSTTWVKNSNRATNAPYTISDGGGTVLVNQELAPNSSAFTWLLESGKYFADLAAGVAVSDGTLVVSLTDVGANEYVVADAVRIERLSPLLSSAGGASPQSAAPALESVPAQTVGRAIAYWAAADVAAAATLSAATILVADLPERHLGLASSVTNTVWLDADAASYGWSLDSGQSPLVSGEGAGNGQAGGVDLWQVLTHEFGHLLGLDDLDADEHAGELMAGELSPQPWQLPVLSIPGVRRLELSDLAWAGSELLSLKPRHVTGVGGDGAGEVRAAVAGQATRRASEAALLAWAENDDEDDDEFLTTLRRDEEDEHTRRVDRVFEASGDWDLAPLAWATEVRPRNVEKR